MKTVWQSDGVGGLCRYHDALWFLFPAGSEDSKSICLQCGKPWSDPWVGKIPWRSEWQPHSRTLAWKIPRTEEPGGLQSTGSQRVGHDWVTSLRKWDILSGNGQIFAKVSALWTTRHVTTTQLCSCNTKAVVYIKKKKLFWLRSNKTWFTKAKDRLVFALQDVVCKLTPLKIKLGPHRRRNYKWIH